MPEGACRFLVDVCSGRASQEPSRDSCTLLVLHCTYDLQQTVEKGHLRCGDVDGMSAIAPIATDLLR